MQPGAWIDGDGRRCAHDLGLCDLLPMPGKLSAAGGESGASPADVDEGEDRLSIFEDFLDQLNQGGSEDEPDADDEEKKD